MIKRILIGLSGTPNTTAEVECAIDLAQAHQAQITAITVIDLARIANVGPVPMGAGTAAAELVQHRLDAARTASRQAGDLVQSACDRAGIRCHLITEAGDPFEEVCSLWRYHDITVLSLRGLFEYGVVHDPLDMTVRIIGRGVRPIIAVGSQHRPVQRVLVAYNGSMEAAKALKQFVQFKPWPHVSVRIVAFEVSEDAAKPLLHDAAEYCLAHGLTVETMHDQRETRHGLDHMITDWPADAVVMGSTARSRLFRHLLGDTALHMVKNANVPLFMSQ